MIVIILEIQSFLMMIIVLNIIAMIRYYCDPKQEHSNNKNTNTILIFLSNISFVLLYNYELFYIKTAVKIQKIIIFN